MSSELPDALKIRMAAVAKALSDNFPGCDVVLIIRPHEGTSASSMSNVDPEESREILEEYLEQSPGYNIVRTKIGRSN